MSRVDRTSVQSNLLNAFGGRKARSFSDGHAAEAFRLLSSQWEREQIKHCLFVGFGWRYTR